MGKICNMMENKDYKSELEKQSLKLIKMTDHEQETLDCLYVDLAKKESGEEIFDQLDDVVKRELDSLNRTAANLNKAIKPVEGIPRAELLRTDFLPIPKLIIRNQRVNISPRE